MQIVSYGDSLLQMSDSGFWENKKNSWFKLMELHRASHYHPPIVWI